MGLSIYIPVWVLWTLGILGGLVLLACAALGVYFMFFLRDLGRSMNRSWGWW